MKPRRGFTLIEILVAITIIGILATTMMSSLSKAKGKAFYAKAGQQFRSFETAIELYLIDNLETYPDDVNRSIPPGLEKYLMGGNWPNAPWPGSVYDWDNWDDPITGEKIYQLSIRFCPIGEPDKCAFPTQEWAKDFDDFSSVYWCFEGACRAHISKPITHPGRCYNCEVQPSG